jgi:transcriptional regulator NrdR family protein
MKCPVCGAWSEVLDTREGQNESVRRRRQCGNGHRFVTLEVHPTVLHMQAVEATGRAISKRRALWRRDQAIRADNRLQRIIAAEHGLSRHQVGKIKQGTRR